MKHPAWRKKLHASLPGIGGYSFRVAATPVVEDRLLIALAIASRAVDIRLQDADAVIGTSRRSRQLPPPWAAVDGEDCQAWLGRHRSLQMD
jgi:hypothetical protein